MLQRQAGACLFLGAKVEEAALRTNDLLNAVAAWRLVAACASTSDGAAGSASGGAAAAEVDAAAVAAVDRAAAHAGSMAAADAAAGSAAGGSAAAAPPDAPPSKPASPPDAVAAAAAFPPYLVGDSYAAAKQRLILDEQLLLRRLRFDISTDQPHRHLYALAHCWGAAPAALRTAVCLLNDAATHCEGYSTSALPSAAAAAAALHVGGQLAGAPVEPRGWWRAGGISDADMAAACSTLLDLLQHASP